MCSYNYFCVIWRVCILTISNVAQIILKWEWLDRTGRVSSWAICYNHQHRNRSKSNCWSKMPPLDRLDLPTCISVFRFTFKNNTYTQFLSNLVRILQNSHQTLTQSSYLSYIILSGISSPSWLTEIILCDVIISANGINFVRLEEENEKEQENEDQDNGKVGGKEDSRKMRMEGDGGGEEGGVRSKRLGTLASSVYDPLIDFIASESHAHPFLLLLTSPCLPQGSAWETPKSKGRRTGRRAGGRQGETQIDWDR